MAGHETFKMHDAEKDKEVEVVANIAMFPVRAEKQLRNYFGQYTIEREGQAYGGNLMTGSIEDLVLQNCVKSLEVDHRKPNFRNNTITWEQLPELYDPETYESIGERLVKLCVQHSPRLAKHRTYAMVFAPYLPDEKDEADPTSSQEGTSTNGASSSSGTEERQENPQSGQGSESLSQKGKSNS